MSYYFLCPNPVPVIFVIPSILKYLDLTESIFGFSEIGESLECIQYSTKKWAFSFFADNS